MKTTQRDIALVMKQRKGNEWNGILSGAWLRIGVGGNRFHAAQHYHKIDISIRFMKENPFHFLSEQKQKQQQNINHEQMHFV